MAAIAVVILKTDKVAISIEPLLESLPSVLEPVFGTAIELSFSELSSSASSPLDSGASGEMPVRATQRMDAPSSFLISPTGCTVRAC